MTAESCVITGERESIMDTRAELINLLQTIPWFQELEPDIFDKIAGICELTNYEAGHTLFREGDKEDYLYIVIEGRVALEIHVPGRGKMRVYTAEAMDIIGWSSITPVVRQRTASARVVLPSRLVRMQATQLYKLCDEDHDLGYVVMRRLSNVVASRLLTTRLQLLDMFAHPEAREV
jgi:CRP/FNR family cyclic AMP-dependent transcriptional regulator